MLLLAVVFAVVVGSETFADEPTTAPLMAENSGQELPEQRSVQSLGVIDLIGAAEDFRYACEALERVGAKYADVVVEVAKSSSQIGGEFDPLVYKSASLVIARQTELIGAQQKIIFDLQTREIERLQEENRRLREQLSSIVD